MVCLRLNKRIEGEKKSYVDKYMNRTGTGTRTGRRVAVAVAGTVWTVCRFHVEASHWLWIFVPIIIGLAKGIKKD